LLDILHAHSPAKLMPDLDDWSHPAGKGAVHLLQGHVAVRALLSHPDTEPPLAG
jgi:hypothetical protein